MLLLVTLACVLDRTGQSATAAYERELALQTARTDAMAQTSDQVERRVEQLEEVMRYRGQQEALRLESAEQIGAEVRRIRGKIETMEHEAASVAEERAALDDDLQFRLDYAELRVSAVESTLGLKPPPAPIHGGTEVGEDGEVTLIDGGEPLEVELPQGAEALLAAAEEHLVAGRHKVARVLLDKFLAEHEGDERASEARYRLAETYYNGGDYAQAILKFEDVVTGDPQSGWAPWAMVRQGECFSEMGQAAEAELFWQDVVARYPRSDAAKDAKKLLGK
jgi:tol-pal system protein YbgF